MYNLYTHIANNPGRCRRFTVGESLFTIYNCGLKEKYADVWSHYNYIVYVVEGRKIWHTGDGAYDLPKGSCVFVRKGASIVEQFFDAEFCFFLFFVPDEFISDVLKNKANPVHKSADSHAPVMRIQNNATITAFFQSIMTYFQDIREPDPSLLELKFRELILTIADNPANNDLLSYFYSLLRNPKSLSLERIMEENFCFNLKMEDFARLCSRSLSAFKRDFQRYYNTTPGKWLMEKRLNHAMTLLTNFDKTVNETAFECGFESASHFSRAFRIKFGVSPMSVKLKAAV